MRSARASQWGGVGAVGSCGSDGFRINTRICVCVCVWFQLSIIAMLYTLPPKPKCRKALWLLGFQDFSICSLNKSLSNRYIKKLYFSVFSVVTSLTISNRSPSSNLAEMLLNNSLSLSVMTLSDISTLSMGLSP